jgi:O-antigen ligase
MLHSILNALFALCFAIVLLTDGGVYPLSLSLAALLMAVVLAGAALSRPIMPGRLWPLVSCLALWALLVGWTWLQSSALPGEALASPAWSVLRQNIGVQAGMGEGRISVAPDDTRFSIIPISLPFFTFMAALLLFRTDEQVARAWRVIGIAGGLLAVFAIVQTVFFPDALMFSTKQAYRGNLTAPFVNRNTAATFYGVVSLILLADMLLALRSGPAETRSRAPEHGQGNRRRAVLPQPLLGRGVFPGGNRLYGGMVYGSLALAALLALALTQSRGGAVASFAGLCVFVIGAILTAGSGKRQIARPAHSRFVTSTSRHKGPIIGHLYLTRHPYLAALLAFLALCAGASVLLGRAALRVETLTPEDSRFCVYRGVMQAISENWLQGIGSGAFSAVFPAYRSPECGVTGVWFRAHNVYLDTILAMGLPIGLLAIVIVIAVLAGLLARGMATRRRQRPVILAAIAATVLVGLHAFLDFSLQIPGVAILFALIAALAANVSLTKPSRA